MQDDSNGENTFEIIDKKIGDDSMVDKTESTSSMSSSISLLPSPGVSVTTIPTGNLLSNVPPPAALPSFVTHPIVVPPITQPIKENLMSQEESVSLLQNVPTTEPFYPTQFSAAIPPSKGVPQGNIPQSIPSGATQDSGGIIGWMKGAVSSGGILSKVAEKAKHSVDSMITTLDPQMREYIYSGGDLDILVASDKEIKISAIREAFQQVFGKATVTGIAAQSTNIAPQPVGFAAAVKAAEERIQIVLHQPKVLEHPAPVVAIENFIVEVGEDKWYDLGVLILTDPIKQINLQTFTQMTPIPTPIVNLAQEDTPGDYQLKWSGLNVTIGSLMANNLHVHNSEWHYALTGVSRREIILTAAKMLATLYKNIIGN
nr:protein PRRC1-like [Onthophagus taurus]